MEQDIKYNVTYKTICPVFGIVVFMGKLFEGEQNKYKAMYFQEDVRERSEKLGFSPTLKIS